MGSNRRYERQKALVIMAVLLVGCGQGAPASSDAPTLKGAKVPVAGLGAKKSQTLSGHGLP